MKHIEFDEFLRHNITEAVFQPAIWRAARADALRAVRAAIEAAGSTQRTLLLVDDNGYYQSMRRNILRIAQQGRQVTGYQQVPSLPLYFPPA